MPETPRLDEIALPVRCDQEDIDTVCLRSLAILFHGTSEAEIRTQLTSPEYAGLSPLSQIALLILSLGKIGTRRITSF